MEQLDIQFSPLQKQLLQVIRLPYHGRQHPRQPALLALRPSGMHVHLRARGRGRGSTAEVQAVVALGNGQGAAHTAILRVCSPQRADLVTCALFVAFGHVEPAGCACPPRLEDGGVGFHEGRDVVPEGWGEFGGWVGDGWVEEGAVTFLGGVVFVPFGAGLGGDVGGVDGVV